jgi:hypothetical protein
MSQDIGRHHEGGRPLVLRPDTPLEGLAAYELLADTRTGVYAADLSRPKQRRRRHPKTDRTRKAVVE